MMPTSNPAPSPKQPDPARPIPARPQPRRVPFTFQCTACEAVEHRPTPTLPDGWAIEEIGDDLYAYCGGCADDLPRPQEPLQ